MTACLIVIGASSAVLAANTEVDVSGSTTDLTTLGLASDSDLTFTNIAYPGAATFTNATALSIGALNDLDATQTITLSNAGGLTLNGGTNSQPGGLPAAADLLYVASGGTLNVQGAVTLASAASGLNLNVAGTSTLSGVVTSTSGNTFTKTGTGQLTFSSASASNVANYVIAAGTLVNGQSSAMGGSGNGTTFGGTITLGAGSGSANATLVNSNTNLNNAIVVASGGTGTNKIGSTAGSGNGGTIYGTLTVNGALTLGNGTGTSAGGLKFGGAASGSGAITIDAGADTIGFNKTASAFTSNFTIVSGTLSNGQSSALGGSGNGTTFGGTITLGAGSGGANAGLSNSNTNLNNAIVIAAGGTGTYKIGSTAGSSNNGTIYGTLTVNNAVTLGNGAGTTAGGLNFGGVISGAGTITVDAGTTNANGNNSVKFNGNNAGSGFTSGILINSGTLTAGNAGALGASNVVAIASGGALDVQNNVTVAGLNNSTTSGVVLNNNTSASQSRTLTVGGSGVYVFGGAITNGTNVNLNTLALTVALTGGGSQTLTGTSTYTGSTSVTSGSLFVNGDHSAASGAVSVTGTGNLGGTGTIGGATSLASGTTLLAGSAAGTIGALTFNSTLSFVSGATVALDLNSASGLSDSVSANGVTLGGATLSLSELSSGAWSGAATFTLLNNTSAGSVGGTFSGLSEGSSIIVGGNTYTISYVGGTGNDITLTAVSAVPEPSTFAALAGAGALGAVLLRRRRQG